MKMLQDDLEKIKNITGKEYEVEYSNNGESEFVVIQGRDVLLEMIYDLLEVIENGNISKD